MGSTLEDKIRNYLRDNTSVDVWNDDMSAGIQVDGTLYTEDIIAMYQIIVLHLLHLVEAR